MWRGIYTAATGMITEMTRTATISNNLANADTAGYKRDEAINREFRDMLIRRINDYDATKDVTSFKGFHLGTRAPRVGMLGLGTYTDEIATDLSQGVLQTTDNQLDVAISGEGFFAVQTPQGVRYTRDGSFFLSSTGQLQTVKGQPILDRNGRTINIPRAAMERDTNEREIMIGPQGQIFVGGDEVAQLQFVQFNDRRAVLKQGDNLFYAQPGAEPQPATGEVQQGVLERSNSQIVMEMVELINNHRVYEAGSKAVVTQDSMLDKSVNEVGRLS